MTRRDILDALREEPWGLPVLLAWMFGVPLALLILGTS